MSDLERVVDVFRKFLEVLTRTQVMQCEHQEYMKDAKGKKRTLYGLSNEDGDDGFACIKIFPIAVASLGPASTGIFMTLEVNWHNKSFCEPPPMI